jgi:hypothetical protein
MVSHSMFIYHMHTDMILLCGFNGVVCLGCFSSLTLYALLILVLVLMSLSECCLLCLHACCSFLLELSYLYDQHTSNDIRIITQLKQHACDLLRQQAGRIHADLLACLHSLYPHRQGGSDDHSWDVEHISKVLGEDILAMRRLERLHKSSSSSCSYHGKTGGYRLDVKIVLLSGMHHLFIHDGSTCMVCLPSIWYDNAR